MKTPKQPKTPKSKRPACKGAAATVTRVTATNTGRQVTGGRVRRGDKGNSEGNGERDAKIQEIIRLTAVTDKGFGKICAEMGMDKETTWATIHGNDELDNQYARAKSRQMEVMAEELGAIADEQPWMVTDPVTGVSRVDPGFETWRKTKLDTRRWLMSKLAPKKYGDAQRIDLQVTGPTLSAEERAERLRLIQLQEGALEV